jgi:hypothetical protein
MAVIF